VLPIRLEIENYSPVRYIDLTQLRAGAKTSRCGWWISPFSTGKGSVIYVTTITSLAALPARCLYCANGPQPCHGTTLQPSIIRGGGRINKPEDSSKSLLESGQLGFRESTICDIGLSRGTGKRARQEASVPPFQVSSFKFQVSSFECQVSSVKFRVTSYRFQVSSFKFPVSSFVIWEAHLIMHRFFGTLMLMCCGMLPQV
jgi:hypothetical protein